jgi:hypothetical protein
MSTNSSPQQKKLFDFIYNFVVDIFSNGIINFIQKMFIIAICVIVSVMLIMFGTWMFFSSGADTFESKHLLKPEVKIEENDTIYVYTLK